jgi:hypothetical protein
MLASYQTESLFEASQAIDEGIEEHKRQIQGTVLLPRILPVWSRLFRTHAKACGLLNQSPGEQLYQEMPKNSDNQSWLGNQIVSLINGSWERDSDTGYEFIDEKPGVLIDTCAKAEVYFMENLGLKDGAIHLGDSTQSTYVDDDKEPVFFRKGIELPSAISFKEVGVNGITYPAGTLFFVRSKQTAIPIQRSEVGNIFTTDSIGAIQPIRLSLFGIPVPERDAVLSDKAAYKSKLVNLTNLTQNQRETTLEDLGKLLNEYCANQL